MRQTDGKRKLISLVAVTIFVLSMIYAGDAAALPPSTDAVFIPSYTPYNFVPELAQSEDNGTYVWWNTDSGSYSDEWEWDNKNWLFGPSPSFEIYHENGSLLTSDHYALIGEKLTFHITVPKGVLQGAGLGRVDLHGWFLTPNWNFSAYWSIGYENFEWTYQPFYGYGHQWNQSDPGGLPLPEFMNIYAEDSNNYTDSNAYYIDIVVSFSADTPVGLYQLDMGVEDTDHNWIGSYNYGSGMEFQGIAIGMSPDDAWSWSYGGSYTLQKLDLDGDSLYSVSRNKDFIMRFNVSGDNPDWVMLNFQTPDSMYTKINRTGWHQQLVTEFGGWEWDDSIGTYVWNATIEVHYFKEVYGEYETTEWTNLGTSEEVNVTYLHEEWDEITQTPNRTLVEQTQWVWKEFFFIYNSTTTSFETKYGYRYWGYPHETILQDTWNEEMYVFQPITPEVPIFYELNLTECSASTIGRDFVVDFVGHFTDLMPQTEQYSYHRFNPQVMGPDGYHYGPNTYGENPRQTWAEFDLAQQISIETPVIIAKLLNADGTEPTGWMFQVDKGTDFMVKTRLQGGSELNDDIDGVLFSMNAQDGYWEEDESWWSQLIYEIEYTMDGTPSMRAFNWTEKHNYTYGTYMDYVYTNVTGWHYVFNEVTSTWEWEYGEFWEWQWAEVEGWHWQWYYFNQLTGEWQEDYVRQRSAETAVPVDFAITSDFSYWTDGSDLYTSFLVNMSESVPDSNYWWDIRLLNNTWFEDYSSEYGEHEVMSWGREWVYSFDYSAERVYMDPINENQLAFNNTALSPDFMLGAETPYITIGDEDLPITVFENYDPWSGNTWKNMFFYDHYDPGEDKDYYYYELTNETKIEVTFDESIWIYNVTTGDGMWFLTASEWDRYWYQGGTSNYYWIDIYGTIHQGPYMTHGQSYVTMEFYDQVELPRNTPQQKFVRYGVSGILNITEYWWVSAENTYYMTDTNGILYELVYDEMTGYYQAFIGGSWQQVSWPNYYYELEYEGQDVYLVTHDSHRFWYHEDTHGVQHEMPYPDANAEYYHHLSNTETEGGKVPTTKTVLINDVQYTVYNETELEGYVDYMGSTYQLDKHSVIHTVANGTDIWNPMVLGYSGEFGDFNVDLAFNLVETLDYSTTSGDYYPGQYFDGDQWNYYISLANGTDWLMNQTYVSRVFEYDTGSYNFYSEMLYPWWYESGNYSWYEYKDINGTYIIAPDYEGYPIVATHMINTYYNDTGYRVFDFMGDTYYFEWFHMAFNAYKVFNATYGGDYYLNMHQTPQRIYGFDYASTPVEARASFENLNRMRLRWGYDVVYGPKPLEWPTYKNFHDFIVGVPQWGMWGVQNWAVNEENGALDLDGDLDTVDDQYFVQEEYSSKDSWTHDYDWMDVSLTWDVNNTQYGDEINVHSWLGLNTFTWTYEWNQTFFWYHADDFSPLTPTEMQDVKDIILTEDDEPRAGYWDLAWMARNVTWQDILDEAAEQGWDWITSNEQSWTWMSFGIGQNFGTSYVETDIEHWLGINLHYEFSGLMLWEDENEDGLMDVDISNPSGSELTHYFIPDYVDDVEFVTPGVGFGNTDPTGYIRVELTDEVTWGVTFYDINGTTFPYTSYGYWGWYDGIVEGSDFRTFDERPVQVTIDEISFLVHFQGYIDETEGALNNYADIKVDNYIGNWDVDMIGGRDNLENKSLALNYFADVNMHDFAFKANGTMTGQEQTVSADTFELETANARFAEMIMGGVTYDWSKNTTAPYDVLSYTTPAGTFDAMYQSESGQSAAAWSFTSTQFYVSIGFPYWDGYSVYQDPVFVSYVSSTGTSAAPPGAVEFSGFSISPEVPEATDSVTVSVDISAGMDTEIYDVQLQYGDSFFDLGTTVSMTEGEPYRYYGEVEPYPDGTTVYYKVVAITSEGTFESTTQMYIVGQGMVTTTPPPGPGPEFDTDTLIMLAGVAFVVIILVIVVSRRRR